MTTACRGAEGVVCGGGKAAMMGGCGGVISRRLVSIFRSE